MAKAIAGLLAAVTLLSAEAPAGRWDAVATIGGLRVPFTLHFEGKGADIAAALVTGDSRVRSKESSFDGKTLRAVFPQAGARMEATLSEGQLQGAFGTEKDGMHPFKASAFCTCGFVGEAGPDISGSWDVKDSGWRVSIRRAGEDTIATLNRGGAETGPLSGRFNGAFFELSYFDGQRGAVLEIEPRKDGALDLALLEPNAAPKKVRAVRP